MLPLAPFGRTGHQSTRVIFGAAALGSMTQDRADATLAMVASSGINHIDTAAGYGESEVRLRPWLADHRSEVFLATKTGEREGADARAELERSLTRMDVDQVDLIQLHNLVEPDEWDVAFGPGGAVAALAAARDEGLVRFIGVTGHGLRIAEMHLAASSSSTSTRCCCRTTSRCARSRTTAASSSVCSSCARNARSRCRRSSRSPGAAGNDESEPRFSWYEPLTDPDAIDRAVRYVLADEQLFLNTTSDARPGAPHRRSRRATLARPTDDELLADNETFGISPLFDGSELERI